MSKIWLVLVIFSIVFSLFGGNVPAATGGMLKAGESAVSLCLKLTGAMTLWSGLMQIMQETGDAAQLGRLIRRLLRPMFPPGLSEESWSAISLNVASNLLGLGNAATPAGIKAAGLLATQGEAGRRALAMLLALNNSCLELLPTTVITLRASFGSADPSACWMPTLISSCAATLTAAMLMLLLGRGGERHDKRTAASLWPASSQKRMEGH